MTVTSSAQPDAFVRRARTLAATAAFATAMVVAFASSPALAVPVQVRQGDTITIVPDCIETEFTVIPASAGSTSVVNTFLPTGCRIDFTASSTYSGPVTVSSLVDTVELIVVGASANASGSFTPVVAPGPCILITANSVVSFGDVELGAVQSQQGNVAPTLDGCAPSSVTQDVLIGASNASSAQSTLALEQPTGCVIFCDPPVAGFYRLGASSTDFFVAVVTASPSSVLSDQAGDFSNESVELYVRLPSTLEPTSIGSLFTFDVTFTAVLS